MPKAKPVTEQARDHLHVAQVLAKRARDYLSAADCPVALDKLRAALRSIDTAARSMDRRIAEAATQRTEARGAAITSAMREATGTPTALEGMPTEMLRSIAAVNKGKPRGDAAAAELARRDGTLTEDDAHDAACELNGDRDVSVIDRDSLDTEHAAGFPLPWIVEDCDGVTQNYATEAAACAVQREHRKQNARDPMTGEVIPAFLSGPGGLTDEQSADYNARRSGSGGACSSAIATLQEAGVPAIADRRNR